MPNKNIDRIAFSIYRAIPGDKCHRNWQDVTPSIKGRYRIMAEAAIKEIANLLQEKS